MQIKTHIGRLIILVENYEDALKFYTVNFDCRVLVDYTTPEGQRFLHIGFDESSATGIWFLKTGDNPANKKIGNQTNGEPTFVLYTNALQALHEKLVKNNVKVKQAPVYTNDYSFFHCYDLYGNEIVVAELALSH
jgi:predicted enzyme related to lactoylglutathione lyase